MERRAPHPSVAWSHQHRAQGQVQHPFSPAESQAGLGRGGAGTRGLTLNLPPNTGDAGGAIAVSPRARPRQLEKQRGGEAGGRLVSPGSLGAESQRDPPLL